MARALAVLRERGEEAVIGGADSSKRNAYGWEAADAEAGVGEGLRAADDEGEGEGEGALWPPPPVLRDASRSGAFFAGLLSREGEEVEAASGGVGRALGPLPGAEVAGGGPGSTTGGLGSGIAGGGP